MKASNYIYGRITKKLEKAVKWLNKNRKNIAKQNDVFDYPDYWDMPKTISSYLSSDEVDWIQQETDDWYTPDWRLG